MLANRDFTTIVSEVQRRIASKYGDSYNDFHPNSVGMMLVDIVAYVAEMVSFYIDRRAKESYLDTAEERSSVEMLTRQLGYRMRAATAASAEVSIALNSAWDFEVELEAGRQLKNAEGVIFETLSGVVWAADTTAAQTVSVRQGETRQITTASTGDVDQVFYLTVGSGEWVADGLVTVLVDGTEWDAVDRLGYTDPVGEEYEVRPLSDPPMVVFGNGKSGAVPPVGAEIVIRYVVCSGDAGNVKGINALVSPLTYGASSIGVTVTQEVRASGGRPAETLEEAKANAPGYIVSGGRAVTRSDYRAIAQAYSSPQYGAVACAQAYVARTISGDIGGNNLIVDIEGEVEGYVANATTDAGSISDYMESIGTATGLLGGYVSEVNGARSVMVSRCSTIGDHCYTLKGRLSDIGVEVARLEAYLSDVDDGGTLLRFAELLELVAASSDGSISTLEGDIEGMRDEVADVVERLTALASEMSSAVSGIQTARGDVVAKCSTIEGLVDEMDAQVSVAGGAALSAKALSDALPGVVDGHMDGVAAAVADLREHLTDVLDADGLANLITVPILAVDGDGNYIAPSVGLMRALEAHLMACGDVAHTVRVVSGASSMVAVAVAVEIEVKVGYVFAELQGRVVDGVKALLRRRAYGADLYLSQVYDLVREIVGVGVCNVTYTSSDIALDAKGNVLVGDEKVIVSGGVTVTQLSV